MKASEIEAGALYELRDGRQVTAIGVHGNKMVIAGGEEIHLPSVKELLAENAEARQTKGASGQALGKQFYRGEPTTTVWAKDLHENDRVLVISSWQTITRLIVTEESVVVMTDTATAVLRPCARLECVRSS